MLVRSDPVSSAAPPAAWQLPARANACHVQGKACEPDQQQARGCEHSAGSCAGCVQQECDNEEYSGNYGEHQASLSGRYAIASSRGLAYWLGFGTAQETFGFTPI